MRILPILAIAICLATPHAFAKLVTVEFEAEAATVTGQPFGMTVPRLTVVKGCFSYETTTIDSRGEGMAGEMQASSPPYAATTNQPARTAKFDMTAVRSSNSFDKCYREISRLLQLLKGVNRPNT